MKKILYKMRYVGISIMLFLAASCSDILDEQPRSLYEPGFFKTEKGVHGGLTSMYAHLRYIYGQAYYYNACQTGTDETSDVQSAAANFSDEDIWDVSKLQATPCSADVLWGTDFGSFNTATAV